MTTLAPPRATFSNRAQALLLRPGVVLGIYLALTLIVTLQHYFKGTYNNYLIFVKPFFNLLEGRNLYLQYPGYYYDTYKYSPTFALFMGLFAYLPTWLGLLGWNLLNTTVLYTASRRLFPDVRRQVLFLWLLLIDMMTALHNSQANCLLVGLMLWVYIHLSHHRLGWAGLCLALAAFIKIYGIGIGLLFLFQPRFMRAGLWAAFWLAVLALAPLLVTGWEGLQMQYLGWYHIVRASATGIQLSLMGILESWFGVPHTAKGLVQAVGLVVLLVPVVHWRYWRDDTYRRLYLASIPIFVVIFNQMAESPTYVIAVAGFMSWFLAYRRVGTWTWALFAVVIVFTTLAATDIYPRAVRLHFLEAYKLKAVPMILAWLVVQAQLWAYPAWHRRLAAAAADAQAAGA